MAELNMDIRAPGGAMTSSTEATTRREPMQREQVISVVEDVKDKQPGQEPKVDRESVAEMIDEMNQSTAIKNTALQFVFEERSEPPVVKVVDQESGEMIRQIPSELAVKLAKALEEVADNKDSASGFLFDKQV